MDYRLIKGENKMGGRGASGKGKSGGGRGATRQNSKGELIQTKEFMGGKQRTVTTLIYRNSGGEQQNYRFDNIQKAKKFAKEHGIEI